MKNLSILSGFLFKGGELPDLVGYLPEYASNFKITRMPLFSIISNTTQVFW